MLARQAAGPVSDDLIGGAPLTPKKSTLVSGGVLRPRPHSSYVNELPTLRCMWIRPAYGYACWVVPPTMMSCRKCPVGQNTWPPPELPSPPHLNGSIHYQWCTCGRSDVAVRRAPYLW